jgi:hypothetical protein
VTAALASAANATETVLVCDVYGDSVAPQPTGVYGIATSTICPGNDAPGSYTNSNPPGGMAIWTGANNTISQGTAVHWTVTAPAGMTISSIYIPHMYSRGIDDNSGWGGGFYWAGGSGGVSTFDGESGWSSGYTGSPRFTWPSGGTPYFGWQVVCGSNPCSNGGNQWLSVELLEVGVTETASPSLSAPDGIWQSSGWIRGSWTLHFGGDSPSGLCTIGATLDGQELPGTSSVRNTAVWHQCSAPAVDETINTGQYGQGAMPLVSSALDAAGNTAGDTKTLYVDNQKPTISLSGPTDAPTTAGTQYVTASAGAGPSGVAGISCSVDGAPSQWYATASVQIPVQGLGLHHVSCFSENNARDSNGNVAASTTATWTLNIREPSVSTLSFDRVEGSLKCHRVRERVRVPAHWVTAYHGGHRVRVKLPAQVRTVNVLRCRPRVIHKRVKVHGHWKVVRIVELPHSALVSTRRLRQGASTTVSGWLGTSAGNAIGGQPVQILTAPSEQGGQFSQVATTTTAADGTWTARLPPGPSRLVVAEYSGASSTEPALSAPAHVIVPARVALHIRPTTARWGGRIKIAGRLRGGYLPPAGELVVLRVGWRGGSTEIGHLYTHRDGRFSTRYTFLRGNGTEQYWIWATTARESDYPYAPGRSRSVAVTVHS